MKSNALSSIYFIGIHLYTLIKIRLAMKVVLVVVDHFGDVLEHGALAYVVVVHILIFWFLKDKLDC